MKLYFLATVTFSLLYACTNPTKNNRIENVKAPAEKQFFFPVTDYLKGQLFEFRNKGINPIKYTTVNNHTDSVWLKMEELDENIKEFLKPAIDSINMTNLFIEKKFLDQTINAFTFTYDPIGPLPDSIKLNHWDVYVDPVSGKVKRIYMVKNDGANKILQLTWQSSKWCKINTIIYNPDGTSVLEKEEKISWEF